MDKKEKVYGEESSRLHRYRLPIVAVFHLLTIVAAYAGAFFIRFDFALPVDYFMVMLSTLPILIVTRAVAFYFYKTHASSWRFAYLRDLVDIIKAVVVGSALFIAAMVFFNLLNGYPRSIFILEPILTALTLTGTKLLFRYYNEYSSKRAHKIIKNVLIVGAGKAGVLMLNEIRSNKDLGINTVGFIDDDNYLKGTNIQGVPVLGESKDIPHIVKEYNIDEAIIAIPSSGYKNVVKISEIARESGVRVNVLPSLGKIIQDGRVSSPINNVSTDELLGRRIIKFTRESDRRIMENEIKGRAVLVTGAGGSIGSELCRQVAGYSPSVLVLYERYETSLYDIERELRKDFPQQPILPVIGDILDSEKLSRIMSEKGISLVYHAAAYKHVPMMEREPIEAVKNNVFGTMNVARLAGDNGVEKFVLVSTDKAVNPANVMGTTKRIAELVIQSMNGNGTKFIAVRFGNVIGSNGSVIPIFRRQIEDGGPVTVTHPDMTRYFMSIAEAVQLVMTAGAMGNGGEIFLLDMGEPVKIVEVARALIELSGFKVEKDIDLVFSGVRPGEKLYEELYWQGEGIVPTENKKITMLKPDGSDYSAILEKVTSLREMTENGDVDGVLRLLKDIVPEAFTTAHV